MWYKFNSTLGINRHPGGFLLTKGFWEVHLETKHNFSGCSSGKVSRSNWMSEKVAFTLKNVPNWTKVGLNCPADIKLLIFITQLNSIIPFVHNHWKCSYQFVKLLFWFISSELMLRSWVHIAHTVTVFLMKWNLHCVICRIYSRNTCWCLQKQEPCMKPVNNFSRIRLRINKNFTDK